MCMDQTLQKYSNGLFCTVVYGCILALLCISKSLQAKNRRRICRINYGEFLSETQPCNLKCQKGRRNEFGKHPYHAQKEARSQSQLVTLLTDLVIQVPGQCEHNFLCNVACRKLCKHRSGESVARSINKTRRHSWPIVSSDHISLNKYHQKEL